MSLVSYKKNLINQKNIFLKNKIKSIKRNFAKKINNNYRQRWSYLIQRNKKINKWKKKIQNEIKMINGMRRYPQKRALIISINYIGSNYELFGCINDGNDIKNKLIKKKYKVTMMTDHSTSNLKPRKNNILSQISYLLRNCYYGDKLFIYYAGHGIQTKDKNNDESDGKDEVFLTLDDKFIKDDDLNQLLNKYMKNNVILNMITDCCHSGSQFDLRYHYNKNKLKVNKNSKNIKGKVFLISGCRDKEVSYEDFINNKTSGALTSTLLKYLTRNISYSHLVNKVTKELKKKDYNQNPQLSSGFKCNFNRCRLIL
jgi:hypothetical protein